MEIIASPPRLARDRGPTLRAQLTLAMIGVALVAILPLAIVVSRLADAYQLAVWEDRLVAAAALVADQVGPLISGDAAEGDTGGSPRPDLTGGAVPASLDALAKRLADLTHLQISLLAPDGTPIGVPDPALNPEGNQAGRREVQQALASGRGTEMRRGGSAGDEILYVAVPIVRDGSVLGVARVALPLSQAHQLTAALTQPVLVVAVLAGLLASLVAAVAARAVARPLGELAGTAAALAADPARPVPASRARGPAEVRELAAILDHLAVAVRRDLERVAAERDRVDAVLGNLADGVVMIDSTGHVQRLNPAAEQLLGMDQRVARGRTVAEVLRDHELVALVNRARTAESLPGVATAFLEWQRPRRFLRAAVTRYGHGTSNQVLLMLQDLTELRRLETIRRDFVANVSHELRTPIAAIKVMVETLRDGALEDSAAAHDFVARIEAEIDGLHQLVEELLELSRLESDRVALAVVPVAPARLVRTAVDRLTPLAERARVRLTADLPSGLPEVDADPERLGHVLVAVIHNAIKFTPPGGAIVVSAHAESGRVRLAVADTGVGIDADDLPRIFERFYKARQRPPEHEEQVSDHPGGGTGLGLAIAKHTVQLIGGAIWAESAGWGRGSTIHLALPVAGAAAGPLAERQLPTGSAAERPGPS